MGAKDENGKSVSYVNQNNQQVYDIADMENFNKEYNELMREDFIIEVNESNKEMITIVRDAVLECDMEFSGQEALAFDRFCEIVEGEE